MEKNSQKRCVYIWVAKRKERILGYRSKLVTKKESEHELLMWLLLYSITFFVSVTKLAQSIYSMSSGSFSQTLPIQDLIMKI